MIKGKYGELKMIVDLSSKEAKELIQSYPGLLLVDFDSPSCTPCFRMLPIIEEVASELTDSFKVVKINAAKEYDLASKHKVTTVPNLLLFRYGDLISRRVGAMSTKDLRDWIQGSL